MKVWQVIAAIVVGMVLGALGLYWFVLYELGKAFLQ